MKSRNAQGLIATLNAVNADDTVRAVGDHSPGEASFCSGQDLAESASTPLDDVYECSHGSSDVPVGARPRQACVAA